MVGIGSPHATQNESHIQYVDDPPPLKWSDLRYVFDIKEDCKSPPLLVALVALLLRW
jgi:hypothetical protein